MKTSIKKIAHKFFLATLLVLMSSIALAQNTISGKVIDPKGKPSLAPIFISKALMMAPQAMRKDFSHSKPQSKEMRP